MLQEPELQRYRSLWESFPYTVNSGDETDLGRDGVPRRVRTKPVWRSPGFSEHCQRMDEMYKHKRVRDNGYNHVGPGSFPTERLKGGSRIQREKGEAPIVLPINCYDIGWLKSLSEDRVIYLNAKSPFDFNADAYEFA